MEISRMAAKRIQTELTDVAKSECGISVEVQNDNLQELKGKISGPPDTPYEGGEFILDIKIPSNYPFWPLKAKFDTKIWHPNISSITGDICLDSLKKSWTPSMTLRTVLLSIQALLEEPAPDDPLNCAAARQCTNNPEMFEQTGRYWAQIYAGAPGNNADFDDKIRKLKDRGVDEASAFLLLSSCSWNLERAMQTYVTRSFFHTGIM